MQIRSMCDVLFLTLYSTRWQSFFLCCFIKINKLIKFVYLNDFQTYIQNKYLNNDTFILMCLYIGRKWGDWLWRYNIKIIIAKMTPLLFISKHIHLLYLNIILNILLFFSNDIIKTYLVAKLIQFLKITDYLLKHRDYYLIFWYPLP